MLSLLWLEEWGRKGEWAAAARRGVFFLLQGQVVLLGLGGEIAGNAIKDVFPSSVCSSFSSFAYIK